MTISFSQVTRSPDSQITKSPFLYIHIPFCLTKCHYCDFLSVPFDQSLSEEYLDALLIEIDMRLKDLNNLKTIYLGGGTPSILSVYEFERLFDRLREIPWSEDIEITMELNPGTVSREKVRCLKELGVNRFSLGIQSFIDRELEILGRVHRSSEGMYALEIIRQEGIENLSLDLIYGIPGQSIKDWQFNLSRATSYSPEHISTYELTPEQGTPFYDLISKGGLKKPDEEEIITMYQKTIDDLTSAGYIHYEISNFAKEGFQCRHNLNYWERGEYIGMGAGAHSFEGRKRLVNLKDVRRYINELKSGVIQFEEEIEITPEEALKEQIFLGLRKIEGLNVEFLKERFQIHFISAVSDLIEDGLLEIKNGHIKLTRRGITISNSVIVRVFESLNL